MTTKKETGAVPEIMTTLDIFATETRASLSQMSASIETQISEIRKTLENLLDVSGASSPESPAIAVMRDFKKFQDECRRALIKCKVKKDKMSRELWDTQHEVQNRFGGHSKIPAHEKALLEKKRWRVTLAQEDIDEEMNGIKRLMKDRLEELKDMFKGADFSGMDLSEMNLSGLDFEGATLAGCDLVRCNLENTVFKGADLRGARLFDAFQQADFRGADLRETKGLKISDVRDLNLLGEARLDEEIQLDLEREKAGRAFMEENEAKNRRAFLSGVSHSH